MRKAIKIVVIGFIGLSIIVAIAESGSKSTKTQPTAVAPLHHSTMQTPYKASSASAKKTQSQMETAVANGWTAEEVGEYSGSVIAKEFPNADSAERLCAATYTAARFAPHQRFDEKEAAEVHNEAAHECEGATE